MILLDASGLVAFLRKEPAAREVREVLRTGEAAIPAPNLAESIDVLVRVFGNDLDEIEATIVPLLVTSMSVVPVGEAEARLAAALRISHYHRTRTPLSLADCLLLATAILRDASIATSDPPLASVARTEGVVVSALKDSSGRRP